MSGDGWRPKAKAMSTDQIAVALWHPETAIGVGPMAVYREVEADII